jgi:hypothetical protein
MAKILRRVSDTLLGIDLLEIQLELVQRQGGPHHPQRLAQRIASAHKELDRLEDLLRLQAEELGLDPNMPLRELRRVLRDSADGQSGPSGAEESAIVVQRRRDRRRRPF